MATLGKNIIVYRNNTAIAGTRSNSLDHSADTIEVSNASVGSSKSYIAGQKHWDVTVNYLVPSDSNTDLAAVLTVGTTYTLVFGATEQTASIKKGLYGSAILKQCRIDSSIGNLVQGTFVFQGTGALAQRT